MAILGFVWNLSFYFSINGVAKSEAFNNRGLDEVTPRPFYFYRLSLLKQAEQKSRDVNGSSK